MKTAQAFRPHVLDMFEPQDHPDDIPYPGGPPTPPYDNAGYTLAFQMGVRFDRVLDEFTGPFAKLADLTSPPAGTIGAAPAPAGYYFTHEANDSFTIVNRLLKAGEDVSWLESGPLGRGTFYVAAKPSTRAQLERRCVLGVAFNRPPPRRRGAATPLRARGIALLTRPATPTCRRDGRGWCWRTSSPGTTVCFRPT